MTNRTCIAPEGCDEPPVARGYCGRHYQRWRKYGDPSVVRVGRRKPISPECLICGGPVHARGYCGYHYGNWWKHGDPNWAPPERERATCSECDRPVKAFGYCYKHYRRFRKHGDPSFVSKPVGNTKRKYSLNQGYFAEIDTPEKAYWLGFIAADGSVSTSAGDFYLRVELSRVDVGHLLKLADALESDVPVRLTKQDCASVTFHSKRLVEHLVALGVTERKSLVIVPPLERLAGLEAHYWRGLWDGDGTVSVRKNRAAGWHIGVVGSFGCVDAFGAWAREICGSTAVPLRNAKDSACWQWNVGGTRKPRFLAERLRLAGAGFGLDRKQVLLQAVCDFDLDSHEARWKEDRGAFMRELWASGRHPRAKRIA